MTKLKPLLILIFFLLQISNFITPTCSSTQRYNQIQKHHNINKDYIKNSCRGTSYPRLCYKSLARHTSKIKSDPKLLAQAALNTTFYAAKATSKMLKELSKVHKLRPNEAAAMLDCVADVKDAVLALEKSTREVDRVSGLDDVKVVMNDVQMWVNTALEEEETCMEALLLYKGVKGRRKNRVRRRILMLAHLTSNALALVKSYALALAKNDSL